MRSPSSFCGALFGDNLQLAGTNPQSVLTPKLNAFQTASRRRTIYRENEMSDTVAVICDGWACVYMSLPDGGRQILGILLPGDITSAAAVFQDRSRVVVEAITDVRYHIINKAELKALMKTNQSLFEIFLKKLAERKEEIENLATDLGHKAAEQRVGRLILSLMERHRMRNTVRDGSFAFPLRQQHIADATGLTLVHVNRVIGHLRRLGIVEIKDRTLTVRDLLQLEHMAR